MGKFTDKLALVTGGLAWNRWLIVNWMVMTPAAAFPYEMSGMGKKLKRDAEQTGSNVKNEDITPLSLIYFSFCTN